MTDQTVHDIDVPGSDTKAPHRCSCGWTGTEAEAAEHARENGLCGECFGTGEGPGPFYGGDDSGIGPCGGCGGGSTAEAQDAQEKADRELDAAMAESEEEDRPIENVVLNPQPGLTQLQTTSTAQLRRTNPGA